MTCFTSGANTLHPYQTIAERNAFGLRQSAAGSPAPANVELLAKIELTGIAEFAPTRWACLQIRETGKPIEHVTLTEGQQSGHLQVITVDLRHSTALVEYRGMPVQLTLKPTNASDQRPKAVTERQADESHRHYHTLREQLDRERDEQERRSL